MKFTSTNIFSFLFSIFLIAGVSFIVFNSSGYLKMHKLQTVVTLLDTQIDSIRKENNILRAVNDSLATSKPKKIERTAREKYSMHKPNEVVIIVDEK